ncbi:MAG: hypothetical protein JWO89_3009 [Verrucomicrobiaceae bacterium]|nr:hypothetical protein [Verrucomicrobiaceae bacterium]
MKRFFKENGLSLTLLVLFLATWMGGQVLVGHRQSNHDRLEHGHPAETLGEYLTSAHFAEATTENWESEFLQMGVYVALTSFLFQKGSSESKPLEGKEPVDRDPRLSKHDKNTPWPVRRGGWVLRIYEYSLSLAFILLFLVCFVGHAFSGCIQYNEDLRDHGEKTLSTMEYMASSRFWFESLQNWQSEFLAILSMVVLSIFLRHRGSPESKPVDAPHSETEG